MRAMSHPAYKYSPWSEERRARAALAAKKRVRLMRAIEIAERLDRRKAKTKMHRELVRLLHELRILVLP